MFTVCVLKKCLGRRALNILYPQIKDNIYVKSYNKSKTQYMWKVPDAALSGVIPHITVQFFYSRMHSLNHYLFIERFKYARNFYYDLLSLFSLFGNILKSAAFLESPIVSVLKLVVQNTQRGRLST